MRRRWFRMIMCICATCAVPALAEGPPVSPQPFPEFTFKRVTVPQPDSTSRINVQITPVAPVGGPGAGQIAGGASVGVGQDELAASGYEWFWAEVSPDIANGGPVNLSRALAVLRDSGGVGAPRLQHLQDIAAVHGLDIMRHTVGTNISPALVVAVISVESGGNASAISRAGAEGLMQLIPATAARFGVDDSNEAAENIRGGVAYLAWLMEKFDQDPILALAGYNAGEGAVVSHGGVPPYAETRAYVPKVLAAWQVARGLCLTPPELMSDGCVFAVRGSPDNG